MVNASTASFSTYKYALLLLLPLCLLAMIPAVQSLQIGPLLSTCVDACQRGCTEIRTVQAAREAEAKTRNCDNNLKVQLKDAGDPRSALTEADTAAHRAIIGALRSEWGPDLRIIGEEDDDDDELAASSGTFPPLKRDTFEDDLGDDTADIPMEEITIYVDPLDGTREFVEGRLDACQVLVGIAIQNQSFAGAIGIPFPNGDLTEETTIVYGIAEMGSGVIGSPLKRGPYPLDRNIDGVKTPRPHHATGDSDHAVMEACRTQAIKRFGGSNVIYGGAGNKILAAALGEVACSIQHRIGGPWDLCAPEAVLKSMGGKMTDLFGEEIRIYEYEHGENGYEYAVKKCNERGYLASPPGAEDIFHEALAAAMVALPEVQKYREEIEG